MKTIYFEKGLVKNKAITNEGLAVYIALRNAYEQCSRVYINSDMISFELMGKISTNKRVKNKINNGIKNLEAIGLIQTIEGNIYNIEKLYINKGTLYSHMSEKELHSIMNVSKNGFDIFSFLRFAILLFDTIYTTTKVGVKPIDEMAYIININKTTAIEYNKILEEMKIIYIHRTELLIRDNNGTINRVSNAFGRYEDSKFIIANANEHCEKVTGIEANKQTKRVKDKLNTRSISKMYNDYCNGTFKGEVKALIKLCEKYNDAMSIKKDMSVFEQPVQPEHTEPKQPATSKTITGKFGKGSMQMTEEDNNNNNNNIEATHDIEHDIEVTHDIKHDIEHDAEATFKIKQTTYVQETASTLKPLSSLKTINFNDINFDDDDDDFASSF